MRHEPTYEIEGFTLSPPVYPRKVIVSVMVDEGKGNLNGQKNDFPLHDCKE